MLESDKCTKSKDLKQRQQFNSRAKTIKLITRTLQREINAFIVQDFSDSNPESTTHVLSGKLIRHVTKYLNAAIQQDKANTEWSRQAAYSIGVELQRLFQDQSIFKSLGDRAQNIYSIRICPWYHVIIKS